ncbi:hypothetical protein NIES4071_105840 (plasmid) [Calothrix sp. NIES-4071]|nr:hypothetical protein NIES4071_105840 [Calothrix sp. NIES-4071]BAZ65002.1 hypothetical protein NIES4105_107350 [Calothrix sp. NIES-4105]
MNDNIKTLKTIAIHALHALLTSDDEPLIKVIHEPLAGENIFTLTFGAPENKDSENADEPYLALLAEVKAEDDGKFDCKIICCGAR